MTDCELDLHKVEFGPNGVKDFFWPLARGANEPVRDYLLKHIPILVVDERYMEDNVALSIRLFFKWFIVENLRWFEAVALERQYSEKKIIPRLPQYLIRWRSLRENKIPPTMFRNLAKGFTVNRPWFPMWLRCKFMEYHLNGSRLRLFPVRSESEINSAFLYNDVTLKHASLNNIYLRAEHPADWFRPIETHLLCASHIKTVNECEFIDKIITHLQRAFSAGGEVMPKNVEGFMRQWILEAGNFSKVHCAHLSLKKERLPDVLWIGSIGASIWGRMMAHAVRSNGGKVYGHDHGYGDAHHDQLGNLITEFADNDKYCTYKETQSNIRKRELIKNQTFIWNSPQPEFTWLDKAENICNQLPESVVRKGRIKRIMYVGTAFHGEGARFRPILSDIVYLDWQARLLGFLQKKGCDILYKPHPEGRTRPDNIFTERFNAKLITGRFEDIDEPIDGYIIDFISSTTTATILRSDLPVIYCDPGYPALFPEAMNLLSERCSIINMTSNINNRMEIDWAELSSVLDKSIHKFNHSFTNHYFG
jgi:hypothetical protein